MKNKMERLRPIYRDIKDWGILDTKIINDYTEDKNPIKIVELLIGTLHYEQIGLNQHYEERRTPIIRWLTWNEYNRLKQNAGTVIW